MTRGLILGAWVIVLAAVPVAFAPPARAAMVTYDFTGTISVLNDPTDLLGGQVKLGDRFSGTLNYDPDTAKSSGSLPTYAGYAYQNLGAGNDVFVSPIGIAATVGSYSVAPDYWLGSMTVGVYNDEPTVTGGIADGIIFQQDRQIGQSLTAYSIFLADTTASAYPSTALPTSITTSDFTDGMFAFYNYVLTDGRLVPELVFQGTIDGLKAVPEPSSLVLCGLAVPILLISRRRFAS